MNANIIEFWPSYFKFKEMMQKTMDYISQASSLISNNSNFATHNLPSQNPFMPISQHSIQNRRTMNSPNNHPTHNRQTHAYTSGQGSSIWDPGFRNNESRIPISNPRFWKLIPNPGDSGIDCRPLLQVHLSAELSGQVLINRNRGSNTLTATTNSPPWIRQVQKSQKFRYLGRGLKIIQLEIAPFEKFH